MKKVAFIGILIAVLAGIVFGGLSIASAAPNAPNAPRPTPTPTPNPCVEMLNRINTLSTQVTNLQTELANVTKMETLSGKVIIDPNAPASQVLAATNTYPEGAHFSVTLNGGWMNGGERVAVEGIWPEGGMTASEYFTEGDGYNWTWETDAIQMLLLSRDNVDGFTVWYVITVTY